MALENEVFYNINRTGAFELSQKIPFNKKYDYLFISSTINLSELLGIRPDLNNLYKILYFHENQLVYPVRKQQERDIQFGLNQILSCIVSDKIYFNSQWNLESFINTIPQFLNSFPIKLNIDIDSIKNKSSVLLYPITIPILLKEPNFNRPVRIVWPHRWEFDKNPESFFNVLCIII